MKKPKIRCSSLPSLLRCFGSRTLQALVTERRGNEAYEGNWCHWHTAHRAIIELGAEPPAGGLPMPAVPQGYKIPRSADWLVGYFFNHARHEYPTDWAMTVELEMEFEFDRFVLTGHQDIHGVNAKAEVCRGSDWKCTMKPQPPASENDQCLGYIVQNFLAYRKTLREQTFDLCQPRVDEDLGISRTSSITLDRTQMERCLSSLNDRVNAALDNPLLVESGLIQCAFCPAPLQCPAWLGDLDLMKVLMDPAYLSTIKEQVDDAKLGDVVMTAKVLARPIEDAMELIKERLKANKTVIAGNGTTITASETAGGWKIVDPAGLYAAAKALITDEARLAKALGFPMGRLQDAIAEEMDIPKTGKADVTAEKVAKAQLHPFAEQGKRVTLQYQAA